MGGRNRPENGYEGEDADRVHEQEILRWRLVWTQLLTIWKAFCTFAGGVLMPQAAPTVPLLSSLRGGLQEEGDVNAQDQGSGYN